MRTRRLAALALVAVLPLVVASCSRAPESFELTIIGTADLQGMMEPSSMKLDADGDGKAEEVSAGGIARLATLIRDIKAERGDDVIVVSVGDDLMNRYFHTFKGQAIFELMSEAGYDLYAFGNHEFDKGPDVLAAALDHATFDCVCTDLAVEGTALEGRCAPYIVRDYGGLSVGFFSLMTEGFPYVTSGKDVEMTGANLEVAHRAVSELRDLGAQVIIALTHVGYERDLEIAQSVPGIDFIFGGHSHEYAKAAHRVGGTFVVNGGEKGPYLVRLDFATDADGKLDVESVTSELIPVTGDVASAPDIEERLAVYQEQFPEAIILGRTDVAWNMTKEAIRQGESPVANLINDCMRDKFGVEIVLNNAGAFRGKKIYEPGPVTDVMLREIDEFSNYAYSLNLEGKYLREVLERSAASFGDGGLLHVSGVRYTVDLTKPAQELAQDEDDAWSVAAPGERVVAVEVQESDGTWAALDPERVYRVLSNSFIVKHEGDGYFWFNAYGSDVENTYSTFYSILAEIAGNEGVLNPSEPDGRLSVVE